MTVAATCLGLQGLRAGAEDVQPGVRRCGLHPGLDLGEAVHCLCGQGPALPCGHEALGRGGHVQGATAQEEVRQANLAPARGFRTRQEKIAEFPTGPIFRNAHWLPWTPHALGIYLYQM